ncbi:hypothetical protein F8388_000569 [Cannabis sativa]|uniref:Uncharacterized protein n=1 Tax=Cannabis sativa TaxID=3483 RepID=A0A7J6F058_CANSA|nr:hypothetical protein F8388_000569 [Cannabis sativa]
MSIKWLAIKIWLAQEILQKSKVQDRIRAFEQIKEDTKLIELLLELHNEGMFKAEGNYKSGYLKALERALATKIPGCDLQARPHIESRMKTLKTHFQIVHEMLTGPNYSGLLVGILRKRWSLQKNLCGRHIYSLPDEEKDHWIRALLIGAI